MNKFGNNTILTLLAALWFILFSACSPGGKLGGGEDFESFYQRFHRDSLFQMERVRFPLDGYRIEGNSRQEWRPDSWVMHKTGIEEIDQEVYQTSRFQRYGEYRELIYIENSSFLVERHFGKSQGKWYLVFYLYIFY